MTYHLPFCSRPSRRNSTTSQNRVHMSYHLPFISIASEMIAPKIAPGMPKQAYPMTPRTSIPSSIPTGNLRTGICT